VHTSDDREAIRSALVAGAREDSRITGAALTGSASVGAEDKWSDIDLAFGIDNAQPLSAALADWTDRMYRDHRAHHHFDVRTGTWIYPVFLLENGLQVTSLSCLRVSSARAPTFRLLFGSAVERPQVHRHRPRI